MKGDTMANGTATLQPPQDLEYKVLGDCIGLLIGLFGLLAGAMVANLSLAYWREDMAQLLILLIMGSRLARDFMQVLTFSQLHEMPPQRHHARPLSPHETPQATAIHPEEAVAGQLPAAPGVSDAEVVAEVIRRIETQKAEALKKSKFVS
jgi:hypothetical protein